MSIWIFSYYIEKGGIVYIFFLNTKISPFIKNGFSTKKDPIISKIHTQKKAYKWYLEQHKNEKHV